MNAQWAHYGDNMRNSVVDILGIQEEGSKVASCSTQQFKVMVQAWCHLHQL
jgi:hypothetical protein